MATKKPLVFLLLARMPELYDQLSSEGHVVLMFPKDHSTRNLVRWELRKNYQTKYSVWSSKAPGPGLSKPFHDSWKRNPSVTWLDIS